MIQNLRQFFDGWVLPISGVALGRVCHKLPLQIFVSLGLNSGRALLEGLKMKGWTFKTQFTHVITHLELRVQNKNLILDKTVLKLSLKWQKKYSKKVPKT